MNHSNPLESIHAVTLLHSTPLSVCSHAVRTCYQSHDKGDDGGPKDRKHIHAVGNINKHGSILEHLVYSFDIQGVSRALLQELTRHRIASLSVKSTRYTLKELKEEESFKLRKEGMGRAANYVVFTGRPAVDFGILEALNNLRQLIASGIPNDLAKFALPDAYKTNLVWTINARSLQNFLYLRTAKSAMWEIRKLAYEVYRQLPEDHKYLFEDSIYSAAENLHE